MAEAGDRMGKRKIIDGDVIFRLPSGGPYRLRGRDLSYNAIAVTVPLDSEAVDDIRFFFSEIATIDHPALQTTAEGRLYKVQRIHPDTLKWLFTFLRKQKINKKYRTVL